MARQRSNVEADSVRAPAAQKSHVVSETTPLLQGSETESATEYDFGTEWKKAKDFLLVEIGQYNPQPASMYCSVIATLN
ncbi:uncharacterized protein GLRG_09281 [Colletotrichum graminicola M1.001]|uniref:Uncharacterized protein n=1 Tax=Colletotrichum graminicola (strain M1.001 / M2 / FGSC 10212) TaxID=645133 RepID=E3QTE9_COLGM|nr:uncharacterized protein GLRG_09281 [Colletotrichum graminicola M1.001]EFQ34137.1 hypothetical protein GLRG_09281 [Colletotrichum graminicola M1.001]